MQKVAVIGAGESGVGCALLAQARGYEVFVSENSRISFEFKSELIRLNIPFEEGGHNFDIIKGFDIIIKSPGISPKVPVIIDLISMGKQIISEIEFSSRFTQAKIIGITGSNGKTTCSTLTYHLLHAGGLNVCLAGNIGVSFARSVIEDAFDCYVLELSSFQLDDILNFNPDIAVILNITPDHLDRYNYEFDQYVRSKFRIVMNQNESDLLILNDRDPTIKSEWKKFTGNQKIVFLSRDIYNNTQLSTDNGYFFDITGFSLKGRHNQLNALCAIHVAQALGVSDRQIQAGLNSFQNLPHRMEDVGSWRGIKFINDSKATNVDSVYYALDSMTSPVIWIAGGTDKGNDYEALIPMVKEKVKCLICLGLDNEKLQHVFRDHVAIILETRDMHMAVELAYKNAMKGDVVLLSPACASFDLFENFEHRGNAFKEAVSKRIKEN